MPLTFLNYPHETFTPTASGALATIVWNCCRVAETRGQRPAVVSIRGGAEPFTWPALHLLDYPAPPTNRVTNKLARWRAKAAGWRHLNQGRWARGVEAILRREELASRPLVIFNDPPFAIFLRRRFPDATIVHWFQNQQRGDERSRAGLADAADVVLACSNFTGRWIEEHYRLPAGSVKTVHNAVDADLFSPADVPPTGPLTVNFVGRTHPIKGPDLLLEAALRVRERSEVPFAIQIVGSNYWDTHVEDAYQTTLRGLADRLEAAGVAVRMPGHVGRDDLPGQLRRAHVHVVPARWDEPFGMTTVEGMACGLATVASRGGGTPEIVGDAALLFEKEDVAGLAKHLRHLLEDPAARRDLAERGRARAAGFSWERTWDALQAAAGVS